MKKSILLFALLFFVASFAQEVFARDVSVRGYTRKDGTYVRPHIRSSPDSSRANNYGPSRNSDELMNPKARDSDGDGTPNSLDNDDDNDGVPDDQDKSQYGTSN